MSEREGTMRSGKYWLEVSRVPPRTAGTVEVCKVAACGEQEPFKFRRRHSGKRTACAWEHCPVEKP